MGDKMYRDAKRRIVPQILNENGYKVLSNGNMDGVDVGKYKLLVDKRGEVLPYQYFDVTQMKFVAGTLPGIGVGNEVDLDGVLESLNSIDADIKNSKYYLTPEMFGAAGMQGVDDSGALNDMYNEARIKKLSVIIPNKTYYCGWFVDARGVSTLGIDGAKLVFNLDHTKGMGFRWGGENNVVSGVAFELSNSSGNTPMKGILNDTSNVKNQHFIKNKVKCLTKRSNGLSNIYGLWIEAFGLDGVTVTDNEFIETNYAVQVNAQVYTQEGSIYSPMGNPIKNITIERNKCEMSSIGINTPHIYCDNVYIRDNEASHHDMPINIAHCGKFVVEGNKVKATNSTDSVIHIEDVSYDGQVYGNTIISETNCDGIRILLGEGISKDKAKHKKPIYVDNNVIKGIKSQQLDTIGIHVSDTDSENVKVGNNFIDGFNKGLATYSENTQFVNNEVLNCNIGVVTTKHNVKVDGLTLENTPKVISSERAVLSNLKFKGNNVPNLYMDLKGNEVITYKDLEYHLHPITISSSVAFPVLELPRKAFMTNVELQYGLYNSQVMLLLEIVYNGTDYTINQKFKSVGGYFGTTITTTVVNNKLNISQYISTGSLVNAFVKVRVDNITFIK